MTQTLKHTSLFDTHVSLHARMVPFAGWEMPVQYTSILAEARAVRTSCGIFDVSHMGRLRIRGSQATDLLEWVATNGVASLQPGRARYSFICNENGGIIDDVIYYRLAQNEYLLVCNAANRRHVLPWLRRWAEARFPNVDIDDETEATAMIAFQGPATPPAMDSLAPERPSTLRPFAWMEATLPPGKALVGRTGYTGEDGFEVILPAEQAASLWQSFMDKGATPCGLGARDVLRLEAGLMLHGNDIDPTTTPLEARLDRWVQLDKEFVGAEALRRQKEQGLERSLVGFFLLGQGIARHGYPIHAEGRQVGQVTSGTFSPTLDRSIGLGYVSVDYTSPGTRLSVEVRPGRAIDAEVVPLPFYSRKRSQ